MLIAKINPVQFIVIKIAVIDNKKIFEVSLNKLIKILLLLVITTIINKRKKDHTERWHITSIAGMNFISLKKIGCGRPQKIEAMEV